MPDVKKIIELWYKLRDTQKEVLHIHESTSCIFDYQFKNDVEQAFQLDPEGLTALLIIDNFREDFFSNSAISIKDILDNPHFQPFIDDCRQLTAMLSEEETVNALANFIGSVSSAISCMSIDREDVTNMVNDRYEMAVLRRDSLRSMETLALHQFFQGDTRTDHLAFLPDIHLFWNMNSLIQCAWQSADGVSINLVQDPMATSSYFAFVAKNGGNLTVLTDKPSEAHPLSKYMSRRPERDFTSRVFKNHFPYGLLDLTFDYKGYLHPGRTNLVPVQDKPIKIGTIATMEPDEIIWTIMMFSLIDGKLYKENYHCAELSYTSDMIERPDIGISLVEQNSSVALMVKDYNPLVAPVLHPENTENDSQYQRFSGSGLNDWLYQRYKDLIPNDILNGLLPSDGSTLFLLSDYSTFLAPKERVKQSFPSRTPVLLKDPSEIQSYSMPGGGSVTIGGSTVEGTSILKKMTGDEFGTKESLMNDYRWFARYNAAKFINKKAEEEFTSRKKDVRLWVKERIAQRIDILSVDMIHALYSKQESMHPCYFSKVELSGKWWEHLSTFGAFTFVKNRKAYLGRKGSPLDNVADAGCWFSEDAPCSYLIKAHVYDLNGLLYLTGCSSPDELPDVLRHWNQSHTADNYIGNPILQRIDPMDWVVKNPWNYLTFDVVIGIGKKYLAKTKKELGL